MINILNQIKLLFKKDIFKSIISNISWLLFDKMFKMGVGLFIGVWFARYLGPEKFGVWSYVFSIVNIISVISGLGLDSIIIREVVKDNKNSSFILGTSFTLRFVSAAILYFLVLIFALVTYNESDNEIILLFSVMSLVFFFQSFDVIDFFFQSKLKSKYIVVSRSFSFIISTLWKVYFILNEGELKIFAIGYSLEFFLSGFFMFISYIKYNNVFDWKIVYSKGRELIKASLPLLFTSMAINIYMRVDQLMLKHMLGNESVGFYAAAVRISEIWSFIPVAISYSLFPSIIDLKKVGGNNYYNKLRNLFTMLIILSLVIVIPIYLFSNEIIEVLFGKKFEVSAQVLKFHIWLGIFIFIGVPARKILIAEDLQSYIFFIATLALLLNIVLNVTLIPIYGINGAVIATLISYSSGSYFFYALFKKTRFVFILQSLSFLPWFQKT